jgi:polyferredoxin
MFLYVVGFVGLIGAAVGRLMCGWVCPFGFLQDLLYKIPGPKLNFPRWARFGKYATLAVLVLIIPAITHVNWFSRLCPAGALEGTIPLRLLPPGAAALDFGWFFWFKIGILVFFLAWMVVTSRSFCRAACPLGAIWALLAPVSLYRLRVDESTCTGCGKCEEICAVDINVSEDPNSPECLRCLDCKKMCPTGSITSGFRRAAGKAEHGSVSE